MTSKTFDERKNMKNVTEMYESIWRNVQNKKNIEEEVLGTKHTWDTNSER